MATYIVTNLEDNGSGSLRDAIVQANNNVGADIINFSGPIFEDGIADTITLSSGQLNITDSLTINGDGADSVRISSNFTSRVVEISQEGTEVTMNGLTIADGGSTLIGGGVYINSGTTANLNNTTLSANIAVEAGGAIANYGTLNLTNSTIQNNSGLAGGGALFNEGTANVSNTTVSLNGALVNGGGIFNSNTGILNLENSTVVGNGVLSVQDLTPPSIEEVFIGNAVEITINIFRFLYLNTALLANESLTGGEIFSSGGGIFNQGTANLTGSNVFINRADDGGGIFNADTANLTVDRSSVFLNGANNGGGIYSAGESTIRESNLFFNTANNGGDILDLNPIPTESFGF
jgi:hypothetical protein